MGFRAARIAAGLSVKEVVETLNVSNAAISLWERGYTKPKADRLLALAALYRCPVEELLRGNPKLKKAKEEQR